MFQRVIVLSGAFVATFVSLSLAQSPPPDRIGNIWGGMSHQPTREEVRDAETKAHTALDAERKKREDEELESLSKQLLTKSR